MNLPPGQHRRVNTGNVIPGREANPESRDSGFDASHRPGMTASGFGDALDEEVEDRLSGLLGLGTSDAPARKMAVDIHPSKAIDQRPAGDLDLLEVRRPELTRRKRFRQRAFGQLDQFGVVATYGGRLVVIEKAAAGDDLEMGRVAHRPAPVG